MVLRSCHIVDDDLREDEAKWGGGYTNMMGPPVNMFSHMKSGKLACGMIQYFET